GIFHESPEVVVVPDISPFSFTARQLIVPVGGSLITSIARAISASSFPQISASCSRNCSESRGLFPLDAALPVHSGLSMPGRQLNEGEAFHASQILRECSVSRFISSKPCATAKRRAPSPTIIT